MKILPDTNILRKIATDDSIYTKFKNKILENDDQCYISPINLNELLYHIRADEDQDEFIQCAKALYRSGELAENRILPNPDDILLILHKHNSFDYIDSKYMEFYLLTRLFENVNHFNDIPSQKDIHVKQNGRRYKITFQNAALIKKYIDQIEKSYIDDIYNKIILPYDPKFLERDDGYGILQILSSKKLREVIRYIKSSNFDKDLTKVIFNLRLKQDIKDNNILDRLEIKIKHIIAMYRNIIIKIYKKGYRFNKKANDVHDIHFSFYLCDPNLILITDDKSFKDNLPKEIINTRVYSMADYLS